LGAPKQRSEIGAIWMSWGNSRGLLLLTCLEINQTLWGGGAGADFFRYWRGLHWRANTGGVGNGRLDERSPHKWGFTEGLARSTGILGQRCCVSGLAWVVGGGAGGGGGWPHGRKCGGEICQCVYTSGARHARFLGLGLGTLGLGFIGSGLGRGVDGLALGLRGGLSTLGEVRWRELTLRIHVGVPLCFVVSLDSWRDERVGGGGGT